MISRARQAGFALPSIIISALVMFTIVTTLVGSVSSVKVALDTQYYRSLARDAAESGVEMARGCLFRSDGVVTWSNTKPLTASTDCSGNTTTECASSCYVVKSNNVRTNFVVSDAITQSGGGITYRIIGKTDLLRTSDSSVWRSYSYTYNATEKLQVAPQFAAGAGWLDNGHTAIFADSNGFLYGNGDNAMGQLGPDLPQTAILKPLRIGLPPNVSKVLNLYTSGQGANIICIIGDNLSAFCQGKPGASENGLMPQTEGWEKFVLPAGKYAKSIYMHGQGADAACVVTVTDEAYCAGDNNNYTTGYGSLGTGNTTSQVIPISAPEKFILPAGLTVKSMFIQDRLTCAIASDYNAYCSGNNTYGTLGSGDPGTNVSTPLKYPLPGGRKAKQIVGNYHQSASFVVHILATDGTIWGSGRNTYGELGNNSTTPTTSPVQYGSTSDYAAILSGPTHFCGITNSGAVRCAGDNTYGQLGTGVCGTGSRVPVVYSLPGGESAKPETNQMNNRQWLATTIITNAGNVYSSGANDFGRFGIGTVSTSVCTPTKMNFNGNVQIANISTLDSYSMSMIGTNGYLYASGRNNVGQLGDGTTIDRNRPVSTVFLRSIDIF